MAYQLPSKQTETTNKPKIDDTDVERKASIHFCHTKILIGIGIEIEIELI